MNNGVSDEHKILYLQMIQGAINRMATGSALFKGFSATIVAGVAVITFSEVRIGILILSYIPLVIFCLLDIYYLQLEKRYRFLYERVRLDERKVDFSLNPPSVVDIKRAGQKKETVSIMACFKSPSIYLFYVPMIIICVIVVVMKASGCLG